MKADNVNEQGYRARVRRNQIRSHSNGPRRNKLNNPTFSQLEVRFGRGMHMLACHALWFYTTTK